jgi:septum formation protein
MLVLASASPRRRELLIQAGFEFKVIPSSVPEKLHSGEDAICFATRLAREKAQAVFEEQSELDAPENPLLVLGADTIVVVDGDILGKPTDAADAARMLTRLSGRTHQVITGVALISRAGVEGAAEVTFVRMQTLSAAEIAEYVASGEPMDKAGAYAIQGRAGKWIPRIQGCYFNVVGLPLALVSGLIEGMHKRLKRSASLMGSSR